MKDNLFILNEYDRSYQKDRVTKDGLCWVLNLLGYLQDFTAMQFNFAQATAKLFLNQN